MDILLPLAVVTVLALAAAAYNLGANSEPTCTQCPHCRQRQLDRERRADEAREREEQLLRAVRALPEPPADLIAEPADEPGARPRPLHRILVAYDGGRTARLALERAAQLAKGLGVSISVLSVVPIHQGRMPIDPWDDQSVHAHQLADAETYLETAGVTAELMERAGDPGAVIAKTADEGAYDAVLVGSDRVGGLARAIFGSVPVYVAAHTRAMVIIVH